MRRICRALAFLSLSIAGDVLARDLSPAKIERALTIEPPGQSARRLDLTDAMRALHVPAVSVALIDGGRIRWAKAWGAADPRTIFQAASLSKTVTAVAALRLVDRGALALDRNVNDDLTIWKAPESALTKGHPVTLRWLLAMRAGVNVPGYMGYAPGAPLPNIAQILNGQPPATSPAVRVVDTPGHAYAYSGGGFEIVQALIEAKSGRSFEAAMRDLVFAPAQMRDSAFAQPPSPAIAARAAHGHDAAGAELPGGWRVVPELAAGGMWSTPTDLAKLLINLSRAYRGDATAIIGPAAAVEMMTPQGGGPDGLGGAVAGAGDDRVFMKRGQNVGYQSYMLVYPRAGRGIVVMTNSDNGTTLATALILKAAASYGWPAPGRLED